MSPYIFIPLQLRDFKKTRNIIDLKSKRNRARHWKREMRRGNRRGYVCVEEGMFIAQGDLVYDSGDPDYTIPGQRIYLSRMVVKHERRGQGIGTAMVHFLCEEARRQGFSEISLGVDKINKTAWHIYNKAGFDILLFDGEDEHGAYVKLMKKL